MPDEDTCREINKATCEVLRDADLKEPPFLIENILDYLEVNRDFYDLGDVTLLKAFWHKVKVKGRSLVKVVRKIHLAAVWLPNEDQILVDSSLPKPKQEWASFHDAVHAILRWHRPYFLGDTAQTLDPDFQEMLEDEANYGASALMFGGRVFTKEALDTTPEWDSIALLKKRHKKSYVTTARRYVGFSHDIPMALLVSTAWWDDMPEDQQGRCRHFVRSAKFYLIFNNVSHEALLSEIDDNTNQRRGGPVGEFGFGLPDVNGIMHEFYAESFYNGHYILTFIAYQQQMQSF
ncbi:MAG: hypothetical protein HQ551_06650 [Desulfobacteraceae bacterium]|nr:hypothetical protein [Desulfobacteraceae bacterium]